MKIPKNIKKNKMPNAKKIVNILLPMLFSALFFSCAVKPKATPSQHKPIPQIRVLLAEVNDTDSILFSGKVILIAEEAQYELGANNSIIHFKNSNQGYKIFNENRIFTFAYNDIVTIQCENEQQYFDYHGKKYAGKIILSRKNGKSLWLINKIDLETYLKGVVPAEIPTFKAEYLQADKAQAICARTYALNNIQQNSERLFHLYADIRSQVYGGIDLQSPQGDKAVDGTKGVVIKYGKELATIYYHSTCGGMLESGSYFGEKYNLPYLHPYKDLLGDDFACSASPYFRWQRRFTFAGIDSLIYAKYNHGIRNIVVNDTMNISLELDILERTTAGRIKKLQINYADTSIVLKGLQIRKFFKDRKGKYLPSTMFTLTAPNDTTLILDGGGYGHGVGLCQYGALSMSEKGFKYYHILYKYFRGTYLEKLY